MTTDPLLDTSPPGRSLLLRLAGPVQTYAGYRHLPNSFPVPTAPMPRKSAIAGLIGAALGSRDLHSLMDAFALHVRIERTNPATEDLQILTTLPGHVHAAADRAEKVRTGNPRAHAHHQKRSAGNFATTLVNRDFIPHAEFLCAITPTTDDAAEQWMTALSQPRYMTFLGRRANPPTFPLLLGLTDQAAPDVLNGPHGVPHATRATERRRHPDDLVTGLRIYRVTGTRSTHEHTLITHATVPAVTRKEQLSWFSQHLSR